MSFAIVGLDCSLYYNAGAIANPNWVEVVHIKDVNLNVKAAEADVSTRGTGGWRAIAQTLKELEISFTLIAFKGDPTFSVLLNAFLDRQSLDVMVLDGDRTVAGSQGIRAIVQLVDFSRSEPLEEGVTYNVVMKAALANPPAWIQIAAP